MNRKLETILRRMRDNEPFDCMTCPCKTYCGVRRNIGPNSRRRMKAHIAGVKAAGVKAADLLSPNVYHIISRCHLVLRQHLINLVKSRKGGLQID